MTRVDALRIVNVAIGALVTRDASEVGLAKAVTTSGRRCGYVNKNRITIAVARDIVAQLAIAGKPRCETSAAEGASGTREITETSALALTRDTGRFDGGRPPCGTRRGEIVALVETVRIPGVAIVAGVTSRPIVSFPTRALARRIGATNGRRVSVATHLRITAQIDLTVWVAREAVCASLAGRAVKTCEAGALAHAGGGAIDDGRPERAARDSRYLTGINAIWRSPRVSRGTSVAARCRVAFHAGALTLSRNSLNGRRRGGAEAAHVYQGARVEATRIRYVSICAAVASDAGEARLTRTHAVGSGAVNGHGVAVAAFDVVRTRVDTQGELIESRRARVARAGRGEYDVAPIAIGARE